MTRIFAATGFALLAGQACFPADKKIEAAAGYEAQQARCVERYDNRASIDACRARVRAAWSTDGSVDAGDDGGAK